MTATDEQITPESDVQRRMASHGWPALVRNPAFWAGAVIVAFFLFISVVPGPVASIFGAGDPDDCTLALSRNPPDLASGHPFGYTIQGCDMYTHVVYGARNSIAIGVVAAGSAAVLGIVIGMLAGYFGGWVDVVASRLAEIIYSMPMILGAIVVLSAFGSRSLLLIAGTLAVLTWVPIMRVVRASTIAASARGYILAAKAMGLATPRVLGAHILPNVLGPAVVLFTTAIGAIIGAESTLTYLGIGLQVPAISWGLQLATAQNYFASAPHLLVFPVIALALAVAGFILLGDALRRAFGVQREAL
ncbi:MAG: ABC transporter permease [Microbacteriaceae bacterium]